jgi:hypothetical protein
MRDSFSRASNWIFICLADSQRSPAAIAFEKQSGSPVRMRTYYPFVHSPGVKCFVFSGHTDCRLYLEDANALFGSAKLMLPQSASTACSFAYFCCCNAKCGAMCCSCRRSCAWACKRSSLACVCSIVVAFPPVLGFRDCGRLRASGESLFAGPFRFGSQESFLPSLLFRVELSGSDENDFGALNMPDRRLMCRAEVQSRQSRFPAGQARFTALILDLLFLPSGVMDVIGRAATLYRK